MTCLGTLTAPPPVSLSHHVCSYPSHLALGGTVEDRVLMHSPKVLHDVIWTHNPAHLDRTQSVRASGPEGAIFSPPTVVTQVTYTYLPAGGTEAFACTADGQGPFPHAREAGCPRPTRANAEMRKQREGTQGQAQPLMSSKLLTGPIPLPAPDSLGMQMLLHSSDLREGKCPPMVTPEHSSTA